MPSFAQTAYKFHLNFPVSNFMKINPSVFDLFYDGQKKKLFLDDQEGQRTQNFVCTFRTIPQ